MEINLQMTPVAFISGSAVYFQVNLTIKNTLFLGQAYSNNLPVKFT